MPSCGGRHTAYMETLANDMAKRLYSRFGREPEHGDTGSLRGDLERQGKGVGCAAAIENDIGAIGSEAVANLLSGRADLVPVKDDCVHTCMTSGHVEPGIVHARESNCGDEAGAGSLGDLAHYLAEGSRSDEAEAVTRGEPDH